jgi:hypothetical protein
MEKKEKITNKKMIAIHSLIHSLLSYYLSIKSHQGNNTLLSKNVIYFRLYCILSNIYILIYKKDIFSFKTVL